MTKIRLTNTMTRKKEDFVPLDASNVRVYLCGPTVYDRAHLGNARNVILFDVLTRLLRHVYGPDHVTYVRNFTDVDDKINAEAQRRKAAGRTESLEALIAERSDETIAWYHADMDALGAARPDHEPRATEYIGQMITMVEGLLQKQNVDGLTYAYAKDGHVLFRVRAYEDYGKLSGRSVDDMIAGARVEVAPFKEDPMDFVLWKPSDAGLPGWASPWGKGRPGWHIECSAMADELLMKGLPEAEKAFDIHGGGLDLQFPHHENELAQSKCAHPKGGFAQVWLHNEMLLVEGKKMSKSLGNFFTVRDLLDQGVPGEVIRFVFLMTHYRKPMDWTAEKAKEAEKTLRKIAAYLGRDPLSKPWVDRRYAKPPQEFLDALANDLNTSSALTLVGKYLKSPDEMALIGALSLLGFDIDKLITKFAPFEFSASDNGVVSGHSLQTYGEGATAYNGLLAGLGNSLSALRNQALETKDFSKVDAMKAALLDAGVEVQMSKARVDLTCGPGFDPAKLEALK